MSKFKIKKGDTVEVIAGSNKGSKGEVRQMLPKKDAAIVEGLNMIKKHMSATQDSPEGGIVELEAPIHVSNLKAVAATKES